MSENENKIMDAADIHKTVKRIAYQIYETHFEEKQLVLAGVAYNGVVLAKRIQEELEKISQIGVISLEIKVDKKNPINQVSISKELDICKNNSIVVVDDVLNT